MKRTILTSLISLTALTSAISIDINPAEAYDPIGDNRRQHDKMMREVEELDNMFYGNNSSNKNSNSSTEKIITGSLLTIAGGVFAGIKRAKKNK